MSTFYEQKFVSAQPLFAEVKEDLRSYFDGGAVDDLMFPKWLEHCLRRFRKDAYRIEEIVLEIIDYQACLPDDFSAVREAWACANIEKGPFKSPTSIYWQTDCRLTTINDPCNECFPGNNNPYCCDGDHACNLPQLPCNTCDQQFIVTNKMNDNWMLKFRVSHLLRPGNMHAKESCGKGHYCGNTYSQSADTFDIRDGKIITNYCSGFIYMQYYGYAKSEEGEQLVPDNFWLQDFIRKFITYKVLLQLFNQVTDETYNQIERKVDRAKQEQEEAFIIAQTEMKKETFWDVARKITRDQNRNNKYKIRDNYRGWRW